MSSNTKNIAYNITQEVSPVVANLYPQSAQAVPDTGVAFTSQGSLSTDGEPVLLEWSVDVPIGSEVEELSLTDDPSERILYPDVNGIYVVTLKVSHPSGAFSTATGTVLVTSLDSLVRRDRPSAGFVGSALSSFWSLLENKEAIESLWGEYLKLLSNDFRKVGEAVLSKSIEQIQTGKHASNLIIKPHLDIENLDSSIKIVPSMVGNSSGSTTYRSILHKCVALSTTNIQFLETLPSVNARGTEIEVFKEGTAAKYKVSSVNSDKINLAKSTPLPFSGKLGKASNVTIQKSNDIAYSPSTLIKKGLYLRVDGDLLEILEDSTTDNTLPGSGYFKLSKKLSVAKYNKSFDVFEPVPVRALPVETGMTNLLYVPAEELRGRDFFLTETKELHFDIISPDRIRITDSTQRKNLTNRLGQSIVTFVNGDAAGQRVTILRNYGASSSDFVVYPSLVNISLDPSSITTAKASVQIPNKAKDLLINVDGRSCEIEKVTYLKTAGNPPLDYLAAIRLKEPILVAGKTNLSWRICSSLIVNTEDDYRTLGVSYGDTLRIELHNSLTPNRSFIDCCIVGSYKNIVAFEPTTQSLIDSSGNFITTDIQREEAVLARIAQQFGLPSAGTVQGEIRFFDVALRLKSILGRSLKFVQFSYLDRFVFSYENTSILNTLHLTDSTVVNTEYRVTAVAKSIKRNSVIPLEIEDKIVSLPVVTEYPYPIPTQKVDDYFVMTHTDHSITNIARKEKVLYDNVHFTMEHNKTFTGYDLYKEKDSLVVTSNSGSFLTREVVPGDLLIANKQVFIVNRVLSETEILLSDDPNVSMQKAKRFTKIAYVLQRPDYKLNTTYLKIRPGVFSVNDPSPFTLHIPDVVLDNSVQIQNNFGILAGYDLEAFNNFSSPQISYKNAIMGLMYASSVGPTIEACSIVASVLLSLPITEFNARVESIDEDTGKITLHEVDENGVSTGKERTYRLPTTPTIPPFYTLAANAEGLPIQLGDILPKYTILSGRLSVQDHVNFPNTFRDMPILKWHSWVIDVDSVAVDTRDLVLLARLFSSLKPIYTKPTIKLTVYLLDEVYILDYLYLDYLMRFYDDPGFSLELSHMFDSSNNSSSILRNADIGEFSTRTLFMGHDLVVTATDQVSSSRGGFSFDTFSPFSSDSVGVDPDTKAYNIGGNFNFSVGVKGNKLVRPGDFLRIHSGNNQGEYLITEVLSDSSLRVSTNPNSSFFTKELESSTALESFSIFREVTPTIVENLEILEINGTTIVTNWDALNWDGVTVNDELILLSDKTVKTEILDVPYDAITQHGANSMVVSDPTLFSVGDIVFVHRDSLVPKNALELESLSYDANEPTRVPIDTQNIHLISKGDSIVLTSGLNEGFSTKIIKITSDSFFVADDIVRASDMFTVQKLARPTQSSSDKRLEMLSGFDKVSLELTAQSANVQVQAAPNTPSGMLVASLNTSDPSVGDTVVLKDGADTVFEGTVYHVSANSSLCFVEYQSTNLLYGTSYTLTIIKVSQP